MENDSDADMVLSPDFDCDIVLAEAPRKRKRHQKRPPLTFEILVVADDLSSVDARLLNDSANACQRSLNDCGSASSTDASRMILGTVTISWAIGVPSRVCPAHELAEFASGRVAAQGLCKYFIEYTAQGDAQWLDQPLQVGDDARETFRVSTSVFVQHTLHVCGDGLFVSPRQDRFACRPTRCFCMVVWAAGHNLRPSLCETTKAPVCA